MTEIEWINIFSNKLVTMMKDSKITQAELADSSGLSRSTINDYIHKRKVPGYKAIINLSYALDCTTDDLIEFGERIW